MTEQMVIQRKRAAHYTHLVGTTIRVPGTLPLSLLKVRDSVPPNTWASMQIIGVAEDVNALIGSFSDEPRLAGQTMTLSVEFYEWCTQSSKQTQEG